MKILAFLQNQWFKDPEGVKAMFAEHPERRERYIEAFLFMGCLTGRRLKSALGEELCNQIVWEEISPEIGGHASSKFPPDLAHIIGKHKPDVVIRVWRARKRRCPSSVLRIRCKTFCRNVRSASGSKTKSNGRASRVSIYVARCAVRWHQVTWLMRVWRWVR